MVGAFAAMEGRCGWRMTMRDVMTPTSAVNGAIASRRLRWNAAGL